MRSFTLVEVIVATLILSIVIAMLFMTLLTGQRSWFSGDAASELNAQVIRAIKNMQKELSETRPSKTDLSIDELSNSITFHIPQDSDGDGIAVDSLGNIEWSDEITYSLNTHNYLIRSLAGNESVLGTNIIALQFARIEDRLLQVDITVKKITPSGQQIQNTAQAIIKMRN